MKACATADAAIAGALGAAAALCGKIAFDGRAVRALVVRAAAVAGLAGATVCAESVFARALAAADSSLVPTVVSVSTNFVISVCSSSFPIPFAHCHFYVLFCVCVLGGGGYTRVLWALWCSASAWSCCGGAPALR